MPTEEQYQESDIWLAEEMGECVHKWEIISGAGWWCPKCDPDYKNVIDGPTPILTPRSKDLGAMTNLCEKLNHIPVMDWHWFNGTERPTVTIQLFNIITDLHTEPSTVEVNDHKSPQHAAAWAIYLALRAVKK